MMKGGKALLHDDDTIYRFNEEGLSHESPNQTGSIKWGTLHKITHQQDLTIFYIAKGMFLYFWEEMVPLSDRERVLEWARSQGVKIDDRTKRR